MCLRPVHRAVCLSAALLCLTGCAATPPPAARVHHVVLCWLKDPGNAEQRQKILAASYAMRQIPGVIDVHGGEPIASDRPIVDASFDVAVTFTFASVEDMRAYLDHPLHKQATQDVLGPLAKKVVIYDFLERPGAP